MKKNFLTLTLGISAVLLVLFLVPRSVHAVQQIGDPCDQAGGTEPSEFLDCGGIIGENAPTLPGTPPSNNNGVDKRLYASQGFRKITRHYTGESGSYFLNGDTSPYGEDGVSGNNIISIIELGDNLRFIDRLAGFSPITTLAIHNQVASLGLTKTDADGKIWTVEEDGQYSIDFSSAGRLAAHVEKRGNFRVAIDFYMKINNQTTVLAGPKSGQSCDFVPYLFSPETQFVLVGDCKDSRGAYYDASTAYAIGVNKTVTLKKGDQVKVYGTIRGYAVKRSFITDGSQDMDVSITTNYTTFDVKKIEALTPSVSISASPTSVYPGGTTTLSWSSANVTSCQATYAWSGARATSGSEVTPGFVHDEKFVITCTGPNGTATATANVTMRHPPAKPSGAWAGSSACPNNWINIAWDPVSDATSYLVKEGDRIVYVGTTNQISDSGLEYSSTHTYTIYATNAEGTSLGTTVNATLDSSCLPPPPEPPFIEELDLCPNIIGSQETVPEGLAINLDGSCVSATPSSGGDSGQTGQGSGQGGNSSGGNPSGQPDLCPNIVGIQISIPEGMRINALGNCVDEKKPIFIEF